MDISYDQFIGTFDGMVNKVFCNKVTVFFDKMVEEGFVAHSTQLHEQFNHKQSKVRSERDDRYLHVPSQLSQDTLPDTWCHEYVVAISEVVNRYCERYSIQDKVSSWSFKLHNVDVGQGYHIFHREYSFPDATDRVLAYMTYINIPEKGGETEFLHQNVRCEPVMGRTLMWPSYFTHLHRGNPVLKGRKLYITGWFNYTG